MSQVNGFIRSKLKDPAELAKLIAKVAGIQAKKSNTFNVNFKGLRLDGKSMTNLDFTTVPTKITFTHNSINYELLKTDIAIVKRIRCRKYMFETNVLTIV